MSEEEKTNVEDEKSETPESTEKGGSADFDSWLADQPEDVRSLYEAKVGGLKTALQSERDERKNQAKQLKRLEELEKAEQKRKEAEMTEMEKLEAEKERLAAENRKLVQNELKRTIAAEVGLPTVLATRIQGEDEEAMREDAKALLEAMPAAEVNGSTSKGKAKVTATHPETGKKVGETEEQKRSRIFGVQADPFDPAEAATHGGGVVFHEKE